MEGRKGFHSLGRLFNHTWHANMDELVKELCNRWRDIFILIILNNFFYSDYFKGKPSKITPSIPLELTNVLINSN